MKSRGSIIRLIALPGIVVHEAGHQVFCRLTATPVRTVCYFSFGDPVGYIKFDVPTSIWKHILISFGPLLVNSTFGFLLGLGAAFTFALASKHQHAGLTSLGIILTWLAASVSMSSFPTTEDAVGPWRMLWNTKPPRFTRLVVGVPLVGTIFFFGELQAAFVYGLFYAFFVAWLLPHQLLGLPWL
jgi:hypothetical protein